MTPPNGRVALVTGANRGMGLETCRQLLGRGLRVVMSGRDGDATERARRGIGDLSHNAIIEAAHRTILKRVGGVDVLVNNAAVLLFENDDVLSIPAEGFGRTFETNLFAV